MSKFELLVLDTIDTVDHMDGEFGDKGEPFWYSHNLRLIY